MAGLRGNQAWILAQKQTAKGTAAVPAVATAYKNPFTGGNIMPVREVNNLSETDTSRDQGISFVSTSGVEGSPEFYARDSSAGFWLFAGLGSVATTGTTPNFTHSITPANTLPYITVWRNIADTLYEQYRDCQVGSLAFSAEAGQPLSMTVGIQGLQATRLTAAPDAATPVPIEAGYVYNFNDATVTLAGGATALVRSFELTIENNISRQQTDNVVPFDVYVGQRTVSLSFDLYFETLAEYNNFHYGAAAGTTVSSQVYTTSAIFDFGNGVNNGIAFNLPRIAYEEFPVEPDAGGEAIVSSIRAVGQRGATPIVTATVKSQVDAY